MKIAKLLVLLALAFGSISCTNVKPWERGHLAEWIMQPGHDGLTDTASEHVWFTREAFAGGKGIGGGGCGCN